MIDTLGRAGTTHGHYRKQLDELVTLIPGDRIEADIARSILIDRWRNNVGALNIADRLNRAGIPSPWG